MPLLEWRGRRAMMLALRGASALASGWVIAGGWWPAGLCHRGTEPGVDHERVGCDAGDAPAVAERGAKLVLADPPGAPVSRLAVAEAHQEAGAAGPQHRRQAGDVPGAALVVEDVEQPAVDDGSVTASVARFSASATSNRAGRPRPAPSPAPARWRAARCPRPRPARRTQPPAVRARPYRNPRRVPGGRARRCGPAGQAPAAAGRYPTAPVRRPGRPRPSPVPASS